MIFTGLVSLVVTTTLTAMIVDRIIEVSKMSDKANTPYKSIIEILIESAALYTVTILICAILVVARACRPDVLWLNEVYDCFNSI